MKMLNYSSLNQDLLNRFENNKNEILPDNIIIDTISYCTLRCAMCPHKDMKRKKGIMSWTLYKKIIDEIAEKKPDSRTWMTFFGEGSALKDLPARVVYGKEKGLSNIVLNSNASRLTPEFSQELIQAGLNTIMVGIDAMREETYQQIRIGGKFNDVINNVLSYKSLLQKYGNNKQDITVQFVQMKENEEELEGFIEFWTKHDIKVKVRPKVSWINKIEAENLLQVEERMPCYWLCNVMSITDTGIITLCATDLDCMMSMGDVNLNSLEEIWNGSLKSIRTIHLKHKWDKLPELCKSCNDWQSGYAKY